jgi:rhodanese-related sulfurtransferase
MELAARTGAAIHAPAGSDAAFPHVPLRRGDRLELGRVRVDVLETPGHTPDHLAFVVIDTERAEDPVGVATGDTLFVGDVGRPDLFPGRARELANRLYDSLHGALMALPDYAEVYPAHGAGSLCGRSLSTRWTSTIGYERRHNPALQTGDREAFIEALTHGMPPAPDHFARCSEINRLGPALLSELPPPEPLPPREFQSRVGRTAAMILDVRGYDAFGGQHIAGAWNIPLSGNFPTFVGWLMPPDAEILLVAEDAAQAGEAIVWCRRVGMDHVHAYLDGGMSAWANAGLDTATLPVLSARGLHERTTGASDLVVLDVRTAIEFAEAHIEGAVNIPAPDLRTRHGTLDPSRPTAVICSTGNRSSMAASMLRSYGWSDVSNVAGGMTGYAAAGFSRECRVCANLHGPGGRIDPGPGAGGP